MAKSVLLHMGKVAFDAVQPRCVSRCKLKANVIGADVSQNAGRGMCGEIVEHNPDAPGVAPTNALEKGEKLLCTFAPLKMSPHLLGSHIVGGKQMTHTVRATVGGTKALGTPLALPRPSRIGLEFQRPKLVHANYPLAPFLGRAVERLDGGFFTSNFGSVDSFHVLVR